MRITLTSVRCTALAVAAAGIVAGVAGPAAATAATIDMPGGGSPGEFEELVYQAAPGENNRAFVTATGSNPVEMIVDDVVPIQIVGEGDFDCFHTTASDLTRVLCTPETDGFKHVGVYLGDGDNTLSSFSAIPMTATGYGATRNVFDGGPGHDLLAGGDGKDTFVGGPGPDTLAGGGEADSLSGGDGFDTVVGGAGDDELLGGAGGDRIEGGIGRDRTTYKGRTSGVDVTLDNQANDGQADERDDVRSDVEEVEGTAHADQLVDVLGVSSSFLGGAGSDTIRGGGGTDVRLDGGPAPDSIDGGGGRDFMFGGDGADTLTGGPDGDVLSGGGDLDTLKGGPGADDLSGGAGFDIVSYFDATERVFVDIDDEIGDDGADGEGDTVRFDVEQLVGGPASDVLTGSNASELLMGGDGNDVLDGGLGNDTLLGGNDNDTLRSKDGVIGEKVDCGPDTDQAATDPSDTRVSCEGQATPAVGIGPKRVRIDDRGRVKLALHCWATARKHCKGTLELEPRGRGRTRALGSRAFRIGSGDETTVHVKLEARARRAAARKRLKLRAVSWSTDASGRRWHSQATLVVLRRTTR